MTENISRTSAATTTVGVRVPADLEQLLMLRALAETVSLIADFALDEVTDIRLALDEVATSLILDAVPGSELTCEFSYGDNRMTVAVISVAATESLGERHSFGWHIVRTLTESIVTEQQPFDDVAGGYPTTARFTWVRGGSDGSGNSDGS
ncbi:ATP-binding protein [Nocardia cyriacigeorgica]|uniref:ATP-binding protein n=1 Tax=Nocardia cyriacigeorgica TaxID=135487 RepID=A0A6P1D7D7_9NOCA|nr:ATP-binding protein [Nocardia cyriacigeorgica]NEW39772.1 ATP-binding protein [Nocardia cyriacigeorgica]NEW45499.1 ATP-binding protein [Nocardia cyriacigeorgica]NEW52406.1 ATP-binding protein [Nocardia cyriacigeorgica]NEW59495.1 ATP-binding protein [Nocardia cyriacigeorgica]